MSAAPAGPTRPVRPAHVVAGLAALLLLATWVSSGSFVMAVLVLVLVGGTVGLGALLLSWAGRAPSARGGEHPSVYPLDAAHPTDAAHLPDAVPTRDLHDGSTAGRAGRAGTAPTAADRVRAALRGLLARPWIHGDALVRAASSRLASPDALVWTPRGQHVAAPHLWVEWNPDDLADLAARWPLDVLARELADGYGDRVQEQGVRRMGERCVLHLMAGPDVPRGRVVVTAAFSRPQRDPVISASTPAGPAGPRLLPTRLEGHPAVRPSPN